MAFLLYAAITLAQFGPAVVSPRPGEALQGMVTITGTSDVVGFTSYEITFAYPDDLTGTWFLISQSSQPVQDGTLTVWDTTTITDGNYVLRLLVFLDDGTSLEVRVPDLRVRNYTPVETATPGPTSVAGTATLPVVTPAIPLPTSTQFPPNPAALTPSRILTSLGYGALAAVAGIALLGVYAALRRRSR
ncbi:MAG: hypothetical protein HY781_00530 [Chloroflexi bacterium]|nr:hypothetical protein [Chloroflexota bacterium]